MQLIPVCRTRVCTESLRLCLTLSFCLCHGCVHACAFLQRRHVFLLMLSQTKQTKWTESPQSPIFKIFKGHLTWRHRSDSAKIDQFWDSGPSRSLGRAVSQWFRPHDCSTSGQQNLSLLAVWNGWPDVTCSYFSLKFWNLYSTSTVLKSHRAGKATSSPCHRGDTGKSHQVVGSHIREEESPWHSLFYL